MRLICPKCNAQYEVPAHMIPPEGREVECSACAYVWQQAAADAVTEDRPQPAETPGRSVPGLTQRGLSEDLRHEAGGRSVEAAPGDLGAAPPLQRPLPEDVLSILREETARELSARRAAKTRNGQDNPAVAKEVAPKTPGGEVPDAKGGPQRPPNIPTTTPDQPAGMPQSNFGDWPATTVTEPDDSEPRVIARSEPKPKRASSSAEMGLSPTPILASAPKRRLSEDVIAQAEEASPAETPRKVDRSENVTSPQRKPLPDAEQIAATLRHEEPEEEPEPTRAAHSAGAANDARGYRAGFVRSLLVTAALLVAYLACASWVSEGNAPQPVADAIGWIDSLRSGLQSLTGRAG
ncbi:zinc-ribbon domain-containing protein [Paracoccus aerodenitrificans]|uniref:zinc-ribbon domain-containing protein n=1 Tax=Paracoccus aerodenitrificans TaxID=3017781 RepID=UPI0022F04FBF|nr:zinc-ribbon domain-containing protein [Paracoccus aerodenitrificans]WBU63313.1 zinc-ribbon domain-containing protein [Paracoccus aerodenitrificans]